MRSNLMGVLLMAVAMFTVSCDDAIETSGLTLDQTQEATITTYLYAELDKTSLGLELAPNGTKVFVSVENSAFNSKASGSWIDTVYVQNGMIESVVPVTSEGVTVKITPADFIQTQVQAHHSTSETLSKIFKVPGGSTVGNVKPGENRVHEITYTDEDFDNLAEFVARRFTIWAITNVEDGLKEVAGAEITFYNGDWSQTVTSNSVGIIEVSLPKSQTTTAIFTYDKKWEVDNNNRKLYRYRSQVASYNESSPVLGDLNFGAGELYE
ncbi:hypothetical protein [Geofilum rubicundum]|nr:hypothetical protein [Geofilum rubicundum]